MSYPERIIQGVNCMIEDFKTWEEKRGGQLCTRPPLIDDPLSKFCPFEELDSGNDSDQADDRQDQEILPDDRVRQRGAVENQYQ